MRSSLFCGAVVLAGLGAGGCIVEDKGGTRGQANAPTASVPDSGSPVRRESAAKTLKDADPAGAADGSTLDVEPAPSTTPPPPVR